MTIARILQIIIGIAGLTALALGLTYWITGADIINFHMMSGLIVALTLLITSILAVSTRGMRLVGLIGIVYALIVPVFGMSQFYILPGDAHWVIRVLHMLVGIGAMALTGWLAAGYAGKKKRVALSIN